MQLLIVTLQYFLSWPQLLPIPFAAIFVHKPDFRSSLKFLLQASGSSRNKKNKSKKKGKNVNERKQ